MLIVELPLTLLFAGMTFRQRMNSREWTGIVAMTAGLAGLLYFLAPADGTSRGVPALSWILGMSANVALIAVLVAAARQRQSTPLTAATLLGVATGAAFELALGMTLPVDSRV